MKRFLLALTAAFTFTTFAQAQVSSDADLLDEGRHLQPRAGNSNYSYQQYFGYNNYYNNGYAYGYNNYACSFDYEYNYNLSYNDTYNDCELTVADAIVGGIIAVIFCVGCCGFWCCRSCRRATNTKKIKRAQAQNFELSVKEQKADAEKVVEASPVEQTERPFYAQPVAMNMPAQNTQLQQQQQPGMMQMYQPSDGQMMHNQQQPGMMQYQQQQPVGGQQQFVLQQQQQQQMGQPGLMMPQQQQPMMPQYQQPMMPQQQQPMMPQQQQPMMQQMPMVQAPAMYEPMNSANPTSVDDSSAAMNSDNMKV